jgi:Subtilase family/Viral BACON domain
MKRLTILIIIMAFSVVLAGAAAFLQTGTTTSNQLPGTYLNQNRQHKLMIKDAETTIYNRLARANAIRQEIDYGSYKLAMVDEQAIGGRTALQELPVASRDDQNMMVLNGYLIDTSNPQPLSEELPVNLKRSRMSAALTGAAPPGKGLYIVQFVGPTKDDWLEVLEKTGGEVIAYVPNNAYMVSAGEHAAGELIKMKNSSPFVQWVGDYEPAYKLRPRLRTAYQSRDSQVVRVTVQIIESPEGRLKADQLRASAHRFLGERRVLKYRNLTVVIPAWLLAEVAQSDEVFAIEEDHEIEFLDEAVGQIAAGNLSGNTLGNIPTGPGYLEWLASKGFNSSQFTSFAVNVADSAYSLRGHPDLPDSRIAFENNPTNVSGPQDNHGFGIAHVIGGFNDGTGPAYEDVNGYNYGLGIVPWARIGVTAIVSLSLPSPTLWEETAYGQGARISNNSWSTGVGGSSGYDTYAQELDRIVRDAQPGVPGYQQMTEVVANGNSGNTGGVNSIAAAKNVIAVGATENVRPTGDGICGYDSSLADNADDITDYSSRGPVNAAGGDGRVKPDIVSPSNYVQSGVPQSNYSGAGACDGYVPPRQTLYGWGGGTSFATPVVTGGAALVYQDFLNKGMSAPSPAMIKAILMNSASYVTGEGAGDTLPSNSQGMGRINLGRAFDGTPRLLTDQTEVFGTSGETYHITGSVASSSLPLRVTLAWTDAPGSTTGAPWVNNLDLEVTINGQTYLGNVFSGQNSILGGLADVKNNVESVYLPAGVSGDFVVTVRATNIAGDGLPGNDDPTDQDFALVIYNANSTSPGLPIIDAGPPALNFTEVVGGPAPNNQTVNLRNAGVDALNWTASGDALWLTLSPAGGTAPSTLTVSVNSNGLSAGNYTGAITISSTNAYNSPVNVPVRLVLLPVFGVSPLSLNFTGAINQGNPANQAVNISVNDSRLMDWTASDDAPWLTVSPAGGAAPAALTASVNIDRLPEGKYNATITIDPADAPDSPIKVPVTLTVVRLLNGEFEGSAAPWVTSGVVMRSIGGYSHSGTGYLLLGGANDSVGRAYQQVKLTRSSSPTLSFWLDVTSNDTAATANDELYVEIRDARGRLLKTLARFSNLDRSEPGHYTLRGDYRLAEFSGCTVRIQFRTKTDSSSVTNFRIDDVSLR